MLEIIAVSLLTIACFGCIFLSAFLRLWKHPPMLKVTITIPTINVRVPIHIPPVDINVPENIKVQLQKVLPIQETDKPTDEPIPEDIVIYCNGESDEWARESRKRRVRTLKHELGNWDAAFRMLQSEDSNG